jgi:hypothetical protein
MDGGFSGNKAPNFEGAVKSDVFEHDIVLVCMRDIWMFMQLFSLAKSSICATSSLRMGNVVSLAG